jgi:hypothetical protein
MKGLARIARTVLKVEEAGKLEAKMLVAMSQFLEGR